MSFHISRAVRRSYTAGALDPEANDRTPRDPLLQPAGARSAHRRSSARSWPRPAPATRAEGSPGCWCSTACASASTSKGRATQVLRLMERLEADPRHVQMRVVYEGPLLQRRYQRFDMGLAEPEEQRRHRRPAAARRRGGARALHGAAPPLRHRELRLRPARRAADASVPAVGGAVAVPRLHHDALAGRDRQRLARRQHQVFAAPVGGGIARDPDPALPYAQYARPKRLQADRLAGGQLPGTAAHGRRHGGRTRTRPERREAWKWCRLRTW